MPESLPDPAAAATPAPPAVRPAATVMFVRDAQDGLQVCLLRRNADSKFVGGASLFPGGAVDPSDGSAQVLARCDGLTEADAQARLRLGGGALAHWVAAIREGFEECALLPARHVFNGEPLDLDEPKTAARFAVHRGRVDRGETPLGAVLETEGLELDLSAIHYVAHWVTPVGAPRRYDTRFFVGRAPAHQPLAHDGSEVVASEWVAPGDALARLEAGELSMLPPTRESLRWLAGFASAEQVLAAAAAMEEIPRWEPRFVTEIDGSTRIVLDDSSAEDGDTPQSWVKTAGASPPGAVRDCGELVPGKAVRLSPLVRRVLAPNPSVMTGTGTNTYLVGGTELAVIDPGPDDPAHLDAIVDAAGGAPIRWILLTHTHPDHWPGAAPLAARTGAQVLAWDARDGLKIDEPLADGDVIRGAGFTLRALHTPGHASNHLCFLLEEAALLFTGDHVMHGSTVVIFPPDGDVGDYLTSLRGLLAHQPPLHALAPGHGLVFPDPPPVIQAINDHRLARERKIADALRGAGEPVTVDDLLPAAYGDVDPGRLPIARGSLWAHLRHLVDQGLATTTGYDDLEAGRWMSVAESPPAR